MNLSKDNVSVILEIPFMYLQLELEGVMAGLGVMVVLGVIGAL
jgi:hypothetical protein